MVKENLKDDKVLKENLKDDKVLKENLKRSNLSFSFNYE